MTTSVLGTTKVAVSSIVDLTPSLSPLNDRIDGWGTQMHCGTREDGRGEGIVMRILWIAGAILSLNLLPGIASAEQGSQEPASDAEATTASSEVTEETPIIDPTIVDPALFQRPPSAIAHLRGYPNLAGLDANELWDLYDTTYEKFEAAVGAADGVPPDSTSGHRLYVDAIARSLEMVDILKEVLARPGELTAEERVDAFDSLLTIEQVTGSLMVEISECERAVGVLRGLAARPETAERPLLMRATSKWLGQAEVCVERERLEEQVRLSELRDDQNEIQRLRQRLADAQQRESTAAAETGSQATGSTGAAPASSGDTLVLSRTELLQVLRESADERRTALLTQSSRLDIASAPLMEYGLRLHYGWLKTPDFAVRLGFDKFTSHSVGDERNNYIGGEVFFRRRHRSQFGLEFAYADLSTEDGWWQPRRKNRTSAVWVENDLEFYSLAFSFEAIAPVDKKERLQLYFRTHVGLSLILGDFKQTRVDGACLGEAGYEPNDPDLFQLGMPCWPTVDSPQLRDKPNDWRIPPVLPTIGASIGARYVFFDRVQLGIEAGWRDVYFYGNANIGFIFARKEENRRVVERNRERVVQEEAAAIESLAN